MSNIDYASVGTFEVKGDNMRVTDPCYDRDTWCTQTLKVMPGKYLAMMGTGILGDWGPRVASLTVLHDSLLKDGRLSETIVKDESLFSYVRGEAGVDAGLCGFFDDSRYPTKGIEEDHDDGWNGVCDALFGENYPASIKDHMLWRDKGIFTSSGVGDGSYSIYANSPGDLKPATALKLIYIHPMEFDHPSAADWEAFQAKQEANKELTKKALQELQDLLEGTQQNSQSSHS